VTADWTELGLRSGPSRSARTRIEPTPMLTPMVTAGRRLLAEPLVGITTDGRPRTDLARRVATGIDVGPVVEAGLAFLATLDEGQIDRLVFDPCAIERRMWLNVHPNLMRHGLLLEDLTTAQRQAALALLAASLSARGHQQARDIMRINDLLIDITGRADDYGEWPYFVSLFGRPSADEPWGWQIDGHHLNLNVTVVGDRLVISPSFMGSEPCAISEGRLAGTSVLVAEQQAGLSLIRSLDHDQRSAAIAYPSILPDDIPAQLQHPIDGRMAAGAFQDNAVIGYQGVVADALSGAQRKLLTGLIATFVGWAPDAHAEIGMDEVASHLDETYFLWMGADTEDGPFYYRVHSPVVLIELDHHPGIVFDNLAPTHHHVHSILRTPNGGDYGTDLLRRHHERFDHRHGSHELRR
jgi:hypothetical protein